MATILAASDWTIAVTSRNSAHNRKIIGKNREVQVKMTLSTTTGNFYLGSTDGGGIPLPTTANTWGMKRNVEYIELLDSDINNGIVWKYSVSSHRIHGFWSENPTAAGGASQLPELPTTFNPSDATSQPVLYAKAIGW